MRLSRHFPESFEFYHLGPVEKQAHPEFKENFQSLDLVNRVGFAYEVVGETHAWIIVLFDSDLDASVYSEMGNVIASRFADGMSQLDGKRVSISAPRELRPTLLASLGQVLASGLDKATYLHQSTQGWIEVDAWVLTSLSEEAADV